MFVALQFPTRGLSVGQRSVSTRAYLIRTSPEDEPESEPEPPKSDILKAAMGQRVDYTPSKPISRTPPMNRRLLRRPLGPEARASVNIRPQQALAKPNDSLALGAWDTGEGSLQVDRGLVDGSDKRGDGGADSMPGPRNKLYTYAQKLQALAAAGRVC